jgi:DNA (cytosine-5)-methyltransferase 1
MSPSDPKRKRHPSAVSLFSGCGGSDLALTQSGFRVKWANDIWPLACRAYEDNIENSNIKPGSIRDFDRFPDAQLLVGCYPCQGYSQGGRRESDEPINYLYQEFDRALRYILPRAFIVENVNGMTHEQNHVLLANQLARYRFAGYNVDWQVLDAKDYGVPQTRRRVFIVGIRSDFNRRYSFPEPTHGPGRSRPYRTQRDAIGRLPQWPDGKFCPERRASLDTGGRCHYTLVRHRCERSAGTGGHSPTRKNLRAVSPTRNARAFKAFRRNGSGDTARCVTAFK